MSRVLTNNVTMGYTRESSLGVAGSTWRAIQPNDIKSWGAEVKTKARRPITRTRQRFKGQPIDLDSKVEIDLDYTIDAFLDFLDGFFYAQAANWDLVWTPSAVTSTVYTISSATSNQAGKVQWATGAQATLLYARGFTNAANNGLKVLTADLAGSGTSLTCSGQGLVAETPPSSAVIEVCGIRASSGDLSVTVSGSGGTLTSGGNINFTTIGVKVGQFIHLGGITSTNQFANGTAYVRVTALASGTLTFDKLRGTLTTDTGSGKAIDILFGRFWRNLNTDDNADDTRFLEQSYQFEAGFPELFGAGTPGYEYSKGLYADQITFDLPLNDLAGLSVGFIGTDTETPVSSGSRKSGASSAVQPIRKDAFSTAGNIASLRTDAMAAAQTGFKKVGITVNNNVSAEKILGQLSAYAMNIGLFAVNLEGQALFADPNIISAIRNGTTVTFDSVTKNGDGGFALDIPSALPQGGNREFPLDKTVLVNMTLEAFQDATLGYSVSCSYFPITP